MCSEALIVLRAQVSLPVTEESKQYEVPPRHLVCSLQQPCNEEFVLLKKQQIIILLICQSGAIALYWSTNQVGKYYYVWAQ